MAKSSRASVIKVNRKKLKARVFGPAEDARTKRLSDKLLELASQPKPPKAEMEIENGMPDSAHVLNLSTGDRTDTTMADPKEVESKAKETKHADGALRSLSIPIPCSMLVFEPPHDAHMLPTPPSTPPCLNVDTFPSPTNHAENDRAARESLFFHFLGVSSDIEGFDAAGDLILNFGTVSHHGVE